MPIWIRDCNIKAWPGRQTSPKFKLFDIGHHVVYLLKIRKIHLKIQSKHEVQFQHICQHVEKDNGHQSIGMIH